MQQDTLGYIHAGHVPRVNTRSRPALVNPATGKQPWALHFYAILPICHPALIAYEPGSRLYSQTQSQPSGWVS